MFETSILVHLCSLRWCSTVDEFAQRNLIWVECTLHAGGKTALNSLWGAVLVGVGKIRLAASVLECRWRMLLSGLHVNMNVSWNNPLAMSRYDLSPRSEKRRLFNHQFLNTYLILFSYWWEKNHKKWKFSSLFLGEKLISFAFFRTSLSFSFLS